MANSSKRFKAVTEKVNPDHFYPLEEVFQLIKDTATAKFDEGVDVAINLGICLLYTSPSPRDATLSRMPSSA